MLDYVAVYILGFVSGVGFIGGYIYWKYRKQIKQMKQLSGMFDPD